jgi:excisionase family DNA binding protein
MDQKIMTEMSAAELQQLVHRAVQNALESAQQALIGDQASDDGRLMTIHEVCDFLHVTKATLGVWRKEGRIPYHRIGRRVYFKLQEIHAAMQTPRPRKGARV